MTEKNLMFSSKKDEVKHDMGYEEKSYIESIDLDISNKLEINNSVFNTKHLNKVLTKKSKNN